MKKETFMTIELTKQNRVLKTQGRCAYFSVVRDPATNVVRMYYRSSKPDNSPTLTMPTRFIESEDGIDFHKPKHDVIMKNSGVCHNLFIFYDTNPNAPKNQKYKALGGTQWRKQDTFWHKREKHAKMPHNTPETHGFRGLYAFVSADGIKWKHVFGDKYKTKHEPAIINRKHKDFITRGRRQAREFDSHVSCFYDNNRKKYILYVRANIRQGVRFVQYATSTDFVRWSGFKLITTDPGFNDKNANYYLPNFYPHPNGKKYMGILPYTKIKQKQALLRLFISDNGIHWTKVEDFFKQRPWWDDDIRQPKNKCHPVNGYIISNDKKEVYFYIHHNYFWNNHRKPVRIIRYSVSLQDIMKAHEYTI